MSATCLHSSRTLPPSASGKNDINDDRSANEGSHGIERDKTGIARKNADQVTKQGDDGACQKRYRKQDAMIGSAQEEPGDMGNGQVNKKNRTAKGCGDGRQQAGNYQQNVAHPSYTHT